MDSSRRRYLKLVAGLSVGVIALASEARRSSATPAATSGAAAAPSSATAPFGQALPPAVKAYFQYLNEEKGGINGRQLNWISYDDGYDPAKALANVRR